MTKMNLETAARAGSVAHMIRGGRLVKRKGQVLSFAPHVGQLCSVSCGALAAGLALGVSLLGAAPAFAGTCDPLLPPPGAAVTCSGALDAANDATVVIKGEQLTINTTPGFGVSTSAGDGLNIETTTGTEFGLIFSDNEASQITAAAGTALAINAIGNTTVTTNGALVGGTYGIKATLTSVGALTLDATGSVEGETLDGINADLIGEARDITVRAATVIGGQNGIDVNNDASGNTFVGSSISVTAINGVGIIVNNQSSSTENLTIDVVNVIGKTGGISDAAILAETINVNNGGTLDGTNNLVATANVNIAGGGALTVGKADGTGVTRITGNLVNAGIVSLRGRTATAGAGDTLNVGGNYAGAGGQIAFDTVLNGDDSLTDLLNVTGNVTGGSVIAINNAGGVGGFTTGDGIRIVRVGGTSAQDGFRLLDDVQAGAFRYDLFLGGVTDPGDQDWYLRTVGLSDVAATTLSFARLSDDIAMTFLGTLHERVGEQEHLAKRGYQSGGVSGIWGRFVGKGFREKLTSPTLGDVKSTGSITGLQMGLDFVRNVKGDGSATFAGAYSGYADGSSSDKNIFQGISRRSGTSDSKGWLAGLYGTHYSSAGWYANVVLQANWVDASANGLNGAVLKTDGRTYLSSFELGQSLTLADRLAFEPQVQLIYGDTQFDAATDSNGIESRVGIESSLLGRAGFRLKTTKSEKYNAEGGLFSGYLKANLWHNLSGADIELFSADQAIGGFEPKKTWVDVGLGTTLTVAKNTEIYFDADVEFGLDKKNTAGRGNVGLRFNW